VIRSASPFTAALVALIAVLLALQGGVASLWQDEPGPGPWPVGDSAQVRPALGVTTLALARNSFVPWKPSDLREVDVFEQQAGHHAGIVMWFADWASTPRFDARQARAIAERGATPEISWEPWDSRIGTNRLQPRYRLRTIIDGDHDALLRRWGRGLAAYGRPVRIRFAHEMNGRWYPWAERFNDNARGEYAQAWRHVRAVVRAQGATNVIWVWCPVTGQVPQRLFPGVDEVDVLGVSGFNGGTALFTRRWRSFAAAFGETLTELHGLAPGKPVELSEIASTEVGGDKAQWITDMFAEIARRPYVQALVWFDVRKESDWRIASTPAAQAAFAAGMASLSRAARRDRAAG